MAFCIVCWFVAKALCKSISNVDWQVFVFQPLRICMGFPLVLTAFIISGWGMQYAYRNIDTIKLSFAQAFLLISLPSLGKYIPGKLFSFAGHSIIAKKFNIRISVSLFVNLLMMGFGLTSASLIGLVMLLFTKQSINFSSWIYQGGAVCLIFIIITIIIYPEIYWKIINRGLGILKQAPLQTRISSLNMAVLFASMLFQNLFYLSGVVVMTSGTIELSLYQIFTLLGVFCIANVIGFLAIFAPAGIGVREGILLVMLTPVIGFETTGLITIIMRIVQTLCDCILGVLGVVTLLLLKKTSSLCV